LLPPIQECREFDPLNPTGNAKPQKKPVEMRLHCSPSHIQLLGDISVVASLQQQLNDLLLATTQTDLIVHGSPSLRLRPDQPEVTARPCLHSSAPTLGGLIPKSVALALPSSVKGLTFFEGNFSL
jgi:hypothetical protein